jgi:hypothetical protein
MDPAACRVATGAAYFRKTMQWSKMRPACSIYMCEP